MTAKYTDSNCRTSRTGTANCARHTMLPAHMLLILLILLIGLAGCQKKVIRTPAPAPTRNVQAGIAADAEQAYSLGDYSKAERLYDQLLQMPDQSRADRSMAWKFYALSAIANGKYHTGLEALDKWNAESAGADTTAEWQQAWGAAIRKMPSSKAIDLLNNVFSDTTRPQALRAEAGLLLAGQQWTSGDTADAMSTLRDVYNSNDSTQWHAALEKRLLAELNTVEQYTLAQLAGELTPENETTYPYSVVLLERARRVATTATGAADWPQAWQALQRLRQANAFADPALVDSVLAPLQNQYGTPVSGIAIALPLTGPYGNIGWKIVRGAGIAQWEMAKQGHDLSVKIINTAAKGWEAELAALPEGYTVVGGPLRKQMFERIAQTGMLDDRTFFAFLSSLPDAEEGRDAWRFFSSPKDQLHTLLDFTQELGVTNASTLYPDEPFGYRMRDLFSQTVEELGIETSPAMSYVPADTTGWGKVLHKYLEVPAKEKGMDDPLPPEPPFQAVFLPDGWKTMEVLVPHFFFFQEDRMIFLGSSLWEQGLTGRKDIDARYYGLAVFPGAWNPYMENSATKSLTTQLEESGLGKADIWVGIGYDFVRFATGLGKIAPGESPSVVNEKIAMAQHMDWSIAPINWDEEGQASQHMFLFTPSSNGFTPVDKERFKKRVQRTRERHYLRVQTLKIEQQKKLAQEAGTEYTGPQEATLPPDFPSILVPLAEQAPQ